MPGSLCLNPTEVELLRALTSYGARFLIVGGHAVQFYGHLREAKDLDLFYSPEGMNSEAVLSGLAALRIAGTLTVAQVSSPRAQIKIGGWYYTELLAHIEGVSFEEAWEAATITCEPGVQVRVISKEHLASTKRALGRPQDLEDLAALGL
jgi:predicted nucleotidyltransferase